MESKMDVRHSDADSFLIDEERLEKLCVSVARQNNELARRVGQDERIRPSELMDLYYAQRGRCAISGVPLEYHEGMKHHRRIQLDHIVEKRARAAIDGVINGRSPYQFGKIACITNVQWVCRFANMIKEYVRSAGVDYEQCLSAMLAQSRERFPIRSAAVFLGSSGAREFREQQIKKILADNPHVSAAAVCNALAGTTGEAHEATIRREMTELGWRSTRTGVHFNLQKECIMRVVSQHGTAWATRKSFAIAVNNEFALHGLPVISTNYLIDHLAIKCGVAIETKFHRKVRKRRACPGDGRAFVEMLKKNGKDGMMLSACNDWIVDRGIDETDVTQFIDGLIAIGCVYRSSDNNSLIAALTRQEAAKMIGVSKNRLKKWGRMDWAGGLSGPAYIKASSKGRTYYTHEDVDNFIAEREPHWLDLSQSGQRRGCVEGGKLGGRPSGKMLQNAPL
jgi:hypothetical protein